MRLIFTILLIGLFKAEGQMIINASYPYRPYAQPAANLLLDDYPNAAAAYSLRKLDKDYTGAAIRVRKDTTGQPEQDIFFTAAGDLDTASLKSFLNARSGFVVTWYNQADSSGTFNTRNLTQSTQANQPRIALNGVIDRDGSSPAIVFDGSNDGLLIGYNVTYTTNDQYISILNSPTSTITSSTSSQTLLSGGTSTCQANESSIFYGSITGNLTNERLSWLKFWCPITLVQVYGYGQTTADISNRHLFTFQWHGTTLSIHDNSSALTTSTSSAGGFTNGTNQTRPTIFRAIGYRQFDNTRYFNGKMQELFIYGSNQSSNRTGIQNNVNNYYSIY